MDVKAYNKSYKLTQAVNELNNLPQNGLKRYSAQKKLETLLQNSTEAIILFDENGVVKSFNEVAQQVFGYSEPEVMGRKIPDLIPCPELYKENVATYIYQFKNIVSSNGTPLIGKHKIGFDILLDVLVGETLENNATNNLIYIGIFNEVTFKNKPKKELDSYKFALEQYSLDKFKSRKGTDIIKSTENVLGEDFTHLSQKFETPINDISHLCQLSLEQLSSLPLDEQKTQRLRQFLTNIEMNSQELLSSLNNYVDLSKLESGKENFNFERHDIYQLSQQVRDFFSASLFGENLTLLIPTPDQPAYAFCDKNKILQVISNLIENAIKFSPNNQSIEILIQHSDIILGKRETDKEKTKGLIVSISDQGSGIPDKELTSIFNNFLQSQKTKTGEEGSGLSLSVCDEIISAHFGKIWAEHNPKGGAIFKIFLPDFRSNSH